MRIKNQDFLKRENQSLVLEMILNHGPISRAEISKRTRMSPTSASRIVATLLEEDLIREINILSEGIGRKATHFVPNEHSVLSIGVELNQNDLRIGFMNFVGKLIVLEHLKFASTDPHEIVGFITQRIQALIQKENINADKIVGVCVGLPGLVQHETGEVKISAQFSWKQVPLKKMLEEQLGFSVSVDNEMKLLALAEYNIDPQPEQETTIAMIGFGSGVGSALISNGQIYRGEGNFSGEIGHTIVDPFGIYCPCGNFGCLQTYIAEKFLLQEASKTVPIHTMEELYANYQLGEKWAVKILDKAIIYAAITINNVVCMYNPDTVVLTGTLIDKYPKIKEQIIQKCKDQIWAPVTESFRIRTTKTGVHGVVIGAAMGIQHDFIKNIHFNKETK
ncbi:ROK family transcriptional regulator [Bacillaceae bacterium SIJ1]|uniref:ROK family transcriptional regulator n=1 Tax=Litoribacterium kuwaitense TaxID=1398745 RepID=UPI0013EA892F|nr:ROK family transcriptional regulator [Litoribacterium kuwaitense]NGP45127.1 ROK family transcriptional regulator [Litoribacterium kuwaitense]